MLVITSLSTATLTQVVVVYLKEVTVKQQAHSSQGQAPGHFPLHPNLHPPPFWGAGPNPKHFGQRGSQHGNDRGGQHPGHPQSETLLLVNKVDELLVKACLLVEGMIVDTLEATEIIIFSALDCDFEGR